MCGLAVLYFIGHQYFRFELNVDVPVKEIELKFWPKFIQAFVISVENALYTANLGRNWEHKEVTFAVV